VQLQMFVDVLLTGNSLQERSEGARSFSVLTCGHS
jgi:hypothetical protein